ncbi:hypothetical protein L6452_39580 [Arctium lappa]|uniref:Uncharacterized protein n=1 Tax=Arctium lappa TaxID=4217 RepID=A0ACB8XSQ2_ARCLA|nr:hypothetical protein L6452_39580 [Arctium lappa]
MLQFHLLLLEHENTPKPPSISIIIIIISTELSEEGSCRNLNLNLNRNRNHSHAVVRSVVLMATTLVLVHRRRMIRLPMDPASELARSCCLA